MRELKFRAWIEPRWDEDDDANKMYYDIQNSYDMLGDVKPRDIMDSFSNWLNNEENATVEQYTGLKDKNGKEIYEGDLIKCYTQEGYPVGKVIYSETFTEYEIVGYDKETKRDYSLEHFGIATNGYLEVIGNIHENKELLDE